MRLAAWWERIPVRPQRQPPASLIASSACWPRHAADAWRSRPEAPPIARPGSYPSGFRLEEGPGATAPAWRSARQRRRRMELGLRVESRTLLRPRVALPVPAAGLLPAAECRMPEVRRPQPFCLTLGWKA